MAWDLLVDRGDLTRAQVVEAPEPELSDGQALLRVDRVGMTANDVTCAVFGDAMHYWDFFPASALSGAPQGRVPLWGFAEVERSTTTGVEEGTRLDGYLPTSSHLVVTPAKVDAKGFRDVSPHRQQLPLPYHGVDHDSG